MSKTFYPSLSYSSSVVNASSIAPESTKIVYDFVSPCYHSIFGNDGRPINFNWE